MRCQSCGRESPGTGALLRGHCGAVIQAPSQISPPHGQLPPPQGPDQAEPETVVLPHSPAPVSDQAPSPYRPAPESPRYDAQAGAHRRRRPSIRTRRGRLRRTGHPPRQGLPRRSNIRLRSTHLRNTPRLRTYPRPSTRPPCSRAHPPSTHLLHGKRPRRAGSGGGLLMVLGILALLGVLALVVVGAIWQLVIAPVLCRSGHAHTHRPPRRDGCGDDQAGGSDREAGRGAVLDRTPSPTPESQSQPACRSPWPMARTSCRPRQGRRHLGKLTITNGTNRDAVAKLVTGTADPKTWQTQQFVYIKANNSVTMEGVRVGTYRLAFMSGVDWDADGRRSISCVRSAPRCSTTRSSSKRNALSVGRGSAAWRSPSIPSQQVRASMSTLQGRRLRTGVAHRSSDAAFLAGQRSTRQSDRLQSGR